MNEDINALVKEFRERKVSITAKRYHKILQEIREASEKANSGLISSEELKLKNSTLMEEIKQCQIIFFSESDFRKFSAALGMEFQVEHEIQHSIPYKEFGISSIFIWSKVNLDDEMPIFIPAHVPYGEKYESLTYKEKALLYYKSLKMVPDPSDWDLYALKELEKKYGKEFFAQNKT